MIWDMGIMELLIPNFVIYACVWRLKNALSNVFFYAKSGVKSAGICQNAARTFVRNFDYRENKSS